MLRLFSIKSETLKNILKKRYGSSRKTGKNEKHHRKVLRPFSKKGKN